MLKALRALLALLGTHLTAATHHRRRFVPGLECLAGHPNAAEGQEPGLGLARVSSRSNRGPAAAPVTIEILPGDLARPTRTREQRTRQGIERYRREVEANPNAAQACNDLAWAYLTSPEALRDVEAALPLARKAVRLASKTAIYRNTLGVAYYRAGRYREAVEVLRLNFKKLEHWTLDYDLAFLAMSRHRLGERALARDYYDWAVRLYILAMSHHRLGERALARDYYNWAVRWVSMQQNLNPEHREELTAFRAEAEKLFGS